MFRRHNWTDIIWKLKASLNWFWLTIVDLFSLRIADKIDCFDCPALIVANYVALVPLNFVQSRQISCTTFVLRWRKTNRSISPEFAATGTLSDCVSGVSTGREFAFLSCLVGISHRSSCAIHSVNCPHLLDFVARFIRSNYGRFAIYHLN